MVPGNHIFRPSGLIRCTIGRSEKNFLFQINFPGVKKVSILSENMVKSGFAWLQAKISVLPSSSGLQDPNLISNGRKLKFTSKVAEHPSLYLLCEDFCFNFGQKKSYQRKTYFYQFLYFQTDIMQLL